MTAADIDKVLRRNFSNFDYLLSNIFFFGDWESDFLCCSGSGYWYEIEIKISKSDFKADFRKKEKYHRFNNRDKETIVIPGPGQKRYNKDLKEFEVISNSIYVIENNIPNRFFYACPEGIIDKKNVPDYAGLYYIIQSEDEGSIGIHQVKPARFLHKRKNDYSKLLLHKYYQRYLEISRQLIGQRYEFDRIRRFYNPTGEENPDDLTLW